MRIGSFTIQLAALLAIGLAGGVLFAQANRGAEYRPPQFQTLSDGEGAGSRAVQAVFFAPTGMGPTNSYVDAYGNPNVVPAGYGCPSCAGGCSSDCCSAMGDGYPGACGGNGCCPGCGAPFCNGGLCPQCVAGTNPPFGEGVENYSLLPPSRTEQCGPHYFDVRMEAVFLTRDKAFNRDVDFTSLGAAGEIVLSSSQLDFDTEPGFRIFGRYDIGPLSVLEFGYTGVETLESSASFSRDAGPFLFSVFSEFANNAANLPPGTTSADGPLPWFERSTTHSISLESELHTGEMNFRRYWVGFNPAISGTLLAGFRFTRLREDFAFRAVGEDVIVDQEVIGQFNGRYLEVAKNDMAGFQVGGDMWVHLTQGLRAGVEGKVGLMNNHYTLDNSVKLNPFNNAADGALGAPFNAGLPEHFEKDIPALVTEASADIVCDVLPSWSIRAGYEIQFLNSVVLAGENFNQWTIYDPDIVQLPPRSPIIFDQSNAFYHGFHAGAEYVW